VRKILRTDDEVRYTAIGYYRELEASVSFRFLSHTMLSRTRWSTLIAPLEINMKVYLAGKMGGREGHEVLHERYRAELACIAAVWSI
jgi:hypothetical protein